MIVVICFCQCSQMLMGTRFILMRYESITYSYNTLGLTKYFVLKNINVVYISVTYLSTKC